MGIEKTRQSQFAGREEKVTLPTSSRYYKVAGYDLVMIAYKATSPEGCI
jgi:hypothetical protein